MEKILPIGKHLIFIEQIELKQLMGFYNVDAKNEFLFFLF